MSAPRTARTAGWIALAALLFFAFAGGGRIVGSDEVTMFELAHALLRGGIAVPEGATLRGPDGRFYTKNTAGQAVLALPLVAAGELAARAAGLGAERAALAARFVASFFNALVSALLLAAFYAIARALGARAGPSLAATAMLGLATPVAVYAKSFMAEPLESLGLLLALGGAALAGAGGADAAPGERRWTRLAALGALLAILAKPGMLPLALLALTALGARRPARWALPLVAVAAGLAAQAGYDVARFGSPFETGYGAQASPAAFSTPLSVGAYGLLFSSGKGLAWFAPAVWLAPWGFAAMRARRAHREAARTPAARAAARAGALVAAAAVVEYGTFQHWGGDGSWGPRYLVPLLPLAMLAVAFALDGASRARRRVAWVLAAAGLAVQVGGLGIYVGAEMREVGDYPYTRALDDPRFMESSHFDPRWSPVVVHWRMLARNAAAHARGEAPRLALDAHSPPDPRLGISPEDQRALLGAIDVWWLYARYAGYPAAPLAAAALALLAAAAWTATLARSAARAEERAP